MFLQWNHSAKKTVLSKTLTVLLLCTFLNSFIVPPYAVQAQTMVQPGFLAPSMVYTPTLLKGLTLYPENPLKFDFIVDVGNSNLEDQLLVDETTKLIKYFLATITVPKDELWVNLSPYEGDRIIPQNFGETEMGRDLLAQDYILKQFTSSLMYPDGGVGKKMWDRIYKQAYEKYGTTKIPVDSFKKVWIVPENAKVYVHENNAFVVNSHLKVMLEEDYLAMRKNFQSNNAGMEKLISQSQEMSDVAATVMREVVLPEIEREVNQGEQFAALRQVYNSMILAIWYKQTLRDSLLGHVYADQNKIKGVESGDADAKNRIYEQYLNAFKQGAYNYIREDVDPVTNEIIPRAYFSGGAVAPEAVTEERSLAALSQAERDTLAGDVQAKLRRAQTDLTEFGPKADINSAILFGNEAAPADDPLEVVDSEQIVPEPVVTDNTGINSATLSELKDTWKKNIDPGEKEGAYKNGLSVKEEMDLLKKLEAALNAVKIDGSQEQVFAEALKAKVAARQAEVLGLINNALDILEKFSEKKLPPDEIVALTTDEKSHVLALIPLEKFSSEAKMLLYSGTPGSGKGTVMEVTFGKGAPFAWMGKQLLLYHTRAPRTGEVDGRHYNFRNPERLVALSKQLDIVKKAFINKQMQGIALEGLNEIVTILAPGDQYLLLPKDRKVTDEEFKARGLKDNMILNESQSKLIKSEENESEKKVAVEKVTYVIRKNSEGQDEVKELIPYPYRLLKEDLIITNPEDVKKDDVLEAQVEARGRKLKTEKLEVKDTQISLEEKKVLRPISGLDNALKDSKLRIMEVGYDWFRKLKGAKPKMFTIFISAFTKDQIELRAKNQQRIDKIWKDSLHRMVAYGMLNVLREEKKNEMLDLSNDDALRLTLEARVNEWFKDRASGKVSEKDLLARIARVEQDSIKAMKNNARIIEGRLINEVNMAFESASYFGIDDKSIDPGSIEEAKAKTLAYEIQWKIAKDLKRGDTSFSMIVPLPSKHQAVREGKATYTKQEDMFNRVVEGVVQMFTGDDYAEKQRKDDKGVAMGAEVINWYEHDPAKRPAVIKRLADEFAGKYFNYLLMRLQEEAIDKGISIDVEGIRASFNKKDAPATNAPVLAGQEGDPVGGIDLNPDFLDLQIERDINGVPLPVYEQPINSMQIEGFIPVIINIYPVTNLPLLIGAARDEPDTQGAGSGASDRISRLQPFFQKEERLDDRRGELSFLLN